MAPKWTREDKRIQYHATEKHGRARKGNRTVHCFMCIFVSLSRLTGFDQHETMSCNTEPPRSHIFGEHQKVVDVIPRSFLLSKVALFWLTLSKLNVS